LQRLVINIIIVAYKQKRLTILIYALTLRYIFSYSSFHVMLYSHDSGLKFVRCGFTSASIYLQDR